MTRDSSTAPSQSLSFESQVSSDGEIGADVDDGGGRALLAYCMEERRLDLEGALGADDAF